MDQSELTQLVRDHLIPTWNNERTKLDRIDRWARWDHDDPHKPRHASTEYKELVARAQAPWGDLIVGSIAQTLYVEGYRRPDAPQDSTGWRIWQANGMDGKQVALHRSVLTYGIAYGSCLPGRTLSGESMPVMENISPRDMIAVFDDPASDEWPEYALKVRKVRTGYELSVYDSSAVWRTRIPDMDARIGEWVPQLHGAGVCPIVRYTNRFDLEGRAAGEIEPFIPVLGKIDQTSFDRLVVQRFASWIVRTISGMSVTESADATGSTTDQVKLKLKVEDLLVAEDPDTKFGSLPATQLDGFIKAHDSDLSVLGAVSQTPAFELLGSLANFSADGLAAVKASQTAKSDERKHTLGEDHERRIRLAEHIAGNAEGASDFEAQVRWADTTIRSLSQAADALGKLATMLGVPVEVLWSKIPGFTQQDIEEAKDIHEAGGGLGKLLTELQNGQTSPVPDAVDA